MQRIVLRNEDERTGPGTEAERRVTLVFPASVTEYEQARVEVETSPRPPDETKPADPDEDGGVTPAGEDGVATAETSGAGYYVVTSDSQRRAWGLPDLVVCHRNKLTVQLPWARHGGLQSAPENRRFAVLSATGGYVRPFRRHTTRDQDGRSRHLLRAPEHAGEN